MLIDLEFFGKKENVIYSFRRLNTSWYEYVKTVNNLRVYDPHTPIFKHLLNHLQKSEILEASKID